jgi:hypothetical protein
VIVHSEMYKRGVGRACLNFYRLRKTTVTSILTGTILPKGLRWRSWLRHCTTSRKVVGLIPDGVTGFFH